MPVAIKMSENSEDSREAFENLIPRYLKLQEITGTGQFRTVAKGARYSAPFQCQVWNPVCLQKITPTLEIPVLDLASHFISLQIANLSGTCSSHDGV